MSETLFDNAAWAAAAPRLSVLVPFKGDDPCLLLDLLAREPVAAEVVVLDDGTADPDLTARVRSALDRSPLPARLVTLAENEGRARGRNRLVSHARAGHFLFLDSDMAPDSSSFLSTWLALIEQENPAVAFGGFSLDQAPPRRDHALHRAMAGHSDCLPAEVRALNPEKHVFTSNLLENHFLAPIHHISNAHERSRDLCQTKLCGPDWPLAIGPAHQRAGTFVLQNGLVG